MELDILIVGAGASGLMAGVIIGKRGKKAVILERENKIGKKLLITGNGKCNYTNLYQNNTCYKSKAQINDSFIDKVLKNFSVQQTIAFFKEAGIYPKEKNGYLYPRSEQASSILESFLQALHFSKIEIKCNEQVHTIKRKKQQFFIYTDNAVYQAKSVILACGGKSYPGTEKKGGYFLASQLGHTILKPVPALVALCSIDRNWENAAGVRAAVNLTLLIEQKQICKEKGELQLVKYGISGIVVFQISHDASIGLEQKKLVEVEIDFLPELSFEQLTVFFQFQKQNNPFKTIQEFWNGFFPKKLSYFLLEECKIKQDLRLKNFSDKVFQKFIYQIQHFKTKITKTNGFENAQVTAGGVAASEINPNTMESKLVKNLYFTGEMIDVDGICGGYNLQWAWSSGYVAGFHA